jgi:hypothetical protein
LAFVDAVEKLGNPYRCTQNIDTEAEIKESNELYDQSRTAPLNIALPKHIISLPIYKSK